MGEIRKLISAEKNDLLDVLGYIAFTLAPKTREERVVDHKDLMFSHYGDKQQAFLDFVLSQYINEDVGELQSEKLRSPLDFKNHGIHDATVELGKARQVRDLFVGFQRHLFESLEACQISPYNNRMCSYRFLVVRFNSGKKTGTRKCNGEAVCTVLVLPRIMVLIGHYGDRNTEAGGQRESG